MANPPVDFRLLAGAGVPARDFKAGDVIFRQGDPAQELFIVQSGEVEIRLGNRVLETLPQYSIFGEMALIDTAPRRAARQQLPLATLSWLRSAKSSFCF